MTNVYIGLGSNLGDRKSFIEEAIAQILTIEGVEYVRVSSLYETSPTDGAEGDAFYNAVLHVTFPGNAYDLFTATQEIEREMGRERADGEVYIPREIDIDILLFGSEIINSGALVIPHPRMSNRLFVLVPLCDIATDIEFPGTEQYMSDILEATVEKVKSVQQIKQLANQIEVRFPEEDSQGNDEGENS